MADSTTTSNRRQLRHVGLLERYSTQRHHLGYYTCVISAAFYYPRTATTASPPSNDEFLQSVYRALHKLIPQYPSLAVTIRDEHTNKPYFLALEKVDLGLAVRVESEEDDIDRVVERELAGDFKDLMEQPYGPCWKAIILPGTVDGVRGFWIVWVFHHAIGDGKSGFIFHRKLLELSNSSDHPLESPIAPLVDLSSSISTMRLPPPSENMYKISLSPGYILKALINEYLPFNRPDPKMWTCGSSGKPVYIAPSPSLRTQVLHLRIPQDVLQAVLAQTKLHKTTLTALLEALLSVALFEVFPESEKVRVSVIVSTRRWLNEQLSSYGGAEDVMGCFVTQFLETFTRATFQLTNLLPTLWSESIRSRDHITQVLREEGKNTEVGLLAYVTDFESFFKKKIGELRQESLELSNVGVFKYKPSRGDQWGIGEVRFSQCASVAGAAMNCSIISFDGGAMCMDFTWQEGVVTKEEMEKVLARTKALLEMVGASA